ncbi:hypothetical protein CEXT_565691 [Caerostris extrusa]|uniref:Uncharacterized protein n=1 Tax=Caerostris extrusa TaxID=172846 RepID=A0AAV4VBY5_CAEEX|nr:hypothetical protein CEXT_565691 [Caerostris extrusa]
MDFGCRKIRGHVPFYDFALSAKKLGARRNSRPSGLKIMRTACLRKIPVCRQQEGKYAIHWSRAYLTLPGKARHSYAHRTSCFGTLLEKNRLLE